MSDDSVAKLLTGKQVKKLAGPGTRVVTYPELKDYGSLDSVFGQDKNIIILYLNEKSGENYVGHWVLLTKRVEDGKNIVEFNDSYSTFPDAYFDDVPELQRKKLEQDTAYLSRLLHSWCKENEEVNEVHYNETPLQKMAPNINTCGRWVGLRARFSDIPLNKYQAEFKKLKKEHYDLDKVITIITNRLLFKK
jgi:hypothetical protein